MLAPGVAAGRVLDEDGNRVMATTMRPVPTTTMASGGLQQSKAPTPKIRSEFPETWLWSDTRTGYYSSPVHA